MKLTWKKNIASDYSIFNDAQKIGSLRKEDLFTDKIIGKIGAQEFLFYKKSIFDSSVSFKNTQDSSQIGNINFNIWNNKANIEFGGKRYTWRYNNFLNNKWIIESTTGNKAEYTSSFSNGEINIKDDDQLMILLGLYVKKYYQRNTFIIFFVLFLPIIIRSILNN